MRKILFKNLVNRAISDPPPVLDDAEISALAKKLERTSRAASVRKLIIILLSTVAKDSHSAKGSVAIFWYG